MLKQMAWAESRVALHGGVSVGLLTGCGFLPSLALDLSTMKSIVDCDCEINHDTRRNLWAGCEQ